MSTFTVLTGSRTTAGSIKEWVNHGSIPSETILTDAQAWIYQRLRVRQMLTSTTGTLTESQGSIALPSGYRGPYQFQFTGTNLSWPDPKRWEWVRKNITYDGDGSRTLGKAQFWATEAANIQFEVLADQAYPWDFAYHRSLAALSTDTETNFLTEEYPRLLRAVCMGFASEWTKKSDDRNYWLAIAASETFEASKESDLEMIGLEMDMNITNEDVGDLL